jgi:hypothetical protein
MSSYVRHVAEVQFCLELSSGSLLSNELFGTNLVSNWLLLCRCTNPLSIGIILPIYQFEFSFPMPVGSYADEYHSFACRPCAADTYQLLTGMDDITACGMLTWFIIQ